ncbi:MAG: ATP-binding protein [Bacteroidia bacterium]|nr:ATP-binding protein [Bacteroidia bacterium]
MPRFFNTTGYCNPEKHYIVNPLRNIGDDISQLIAQESYFVIHAPRQSGKTTLLHAMTRKLNKEGNYIAVVFSVETAGYQSITEPEANKKIIRAIYQKATEFLQTEYLPEDPLEFKGEYIGVYLNEWAVKMPKPIVLFIDEIDALYDDVLVSMLRQLRDGFQSRPKYFPASVALIGLRDVRDYKLKSRYSDGSLGSGSPFNIKAESFMLKNFTREEINLLYNQHTQETGQVFPAHVIDEIYELSGGQPWLTNAIAREITQNILKNDYSREITMEIVLQAKESLIQRRDTHLDSLLDKLKEERVKKIITNIINGDSPLFDTFNDDLKYCIDLGIVKNENNRILFSNKIYKEIVPRVLSYHWQMGIGEEGDSNWYIKDDRLDMDKLLKAFQNFYRENSEHWIDRFNYKEAGQQLLLMAFLQRVINANGRIEREMAVGRGRTDLVVHFGKDRYVLELKIKHKSFLKEKGFDQLSRYLDTLGLKKGYLILFEPAKSSEVAWEQRIKWETVKHDKKAITVVEM